MKKLFYTILFSAILLMQQLEVNAQRFRAGISAGLVATDVYGSDIYDNDNDFFKAGFMFGGTVSTTLNKKLTLELELNYIQKGTQQPADANGNGFYKFSFNYLEFPFILNYRFHFNIGAKSVNGLYLHAGISIGRLISNKGEGDNFYSNNDADYLNKTDVSLLAGLGYNFSEHFNFCFRYSNSVIPVFKQNSASPIPFASTFNNGNNLVLHFILQFTFGAAKNEIPAKEEN
ncbi:MAG: porin family protein [Bacteroidia bacterium]